MKKPKVLVVDDVFANLVAMRRVLNSLDLELYEALSGNDALRLCLENNDFAVVLMDVQMPEMDGFEAASFIRNNDQTSHIPIIFVTAFEKGELRAFDDGIAAYDYICKPVDDGMLKSKMKFFLDLYNNKQKVVEQHSQFSTVLQCMGEGVIVTDNEGHFIHFNEVAEKLVGIGKTDTVPDEWVSTYGFFHIDKKTLFKTEELPIVRVLNGEDRLKKQMFIRNRYNPEGVCIDMTATVLRDEHGNVLGAVAIFHDIGERLDYEESLKNSKKLAERATKLKADFLANMSHEIRTPMNGIIGACDLLMDTQQDDDQKELTEMVSHSASSLLTIINDILDSSKIEAGKLDIEMLPIHLKRILDDVVLMMNSTIEGKDLVLELNFPENYPEFLMGDPTRIRQVVLNLVANAVKFTVRGRVSIDVEFLQRKNRLKYDVKIAVSDTGIGIAPEQLENIFSSFSQADSTITRKFGGTGLGLSISNSLASLMGGHISVESVEGEGSTFTLHLSMETGKKYIDEKAETSSLLRNYKKKVLLAEDNKVNQKVAIKMLVKMGLQVDLAENGLKAIEMSRTKKYDMIFMDMQMPECDGLTATREIREIDKEIPILAMTANVMEVERKQCFDSGMDEVITKPISKEAIVIQLDKWFL